MEVNITKEQEKFYNIKGFEKVSKLRENRRRGWIIVCIKKGIKWEEIETITYNSFEHIQIGLETQTKEVIDEIICTHLNIMQLA